MPERRRGSGGSRQPDLFVRSKQPKISLPDNHPMVVLTDTVDWTEMEVRAAKIREKKLKNAAGRPPHLRATLGALTLMALRRLPYREVEEQIRYYAPARYLCGLTETDWTPDFTTIQDFAQLMGEDGVKLINEGVVEQAVKLGLADTKVVVADLTAQEAAIPHPNEMGLLGGFVRSLEAAAGKAGHLFKQFLAKADHKFRAAKEQVRKYRLFAKDKTKAAKDKMVAQMASIVAGINQQRGKGLAAGAEHLAQLLVDPCHDARHLRDHLVLGRLGLVLGEEPVLAHLLLGRPELVVGLGQELLEKVTCFAGRCLQRSDEAAEQSHLVGMRYRRLLRRQVGDHHLGIGQAELDRLLDDSFVDQLHAVLAHQLREVLDRSEVRRPVGLRQPAKISRRRVVPNLLLHLAVGQPPERHQRQCPQRGPQMWRPPRRVLELLLADLRGPHLHLRPVHRVGQDDHWVIVR